MHCQYNTRVVARPAATAMDRNAAPSPLTLLLELGQAFHSTLELEPLLASILKQLQSAVRSEGGSIWLLDEARTRLECTHAIGPGTETVLHKTIDAGDFLAVYAANNGEAIKIDDASVDNVVTRHFGEIVRLRTRNTIIAPLVARAEVLGSLNVINKLDAPTFSNDDRALLEALAGHAAIAIHNAQLYERQQRNSH